jgi:hypothetical protein
VTQHGTTQPPMFAVISGAQVQATLAGREQEIVDSELTVIGDFFHDMTRHG